MATLAIAPARRTLSTARSQAVRRSTWISGGGPAARVRASTSRLRASVSSRSTSSSADSTAAPTASFSAVSGRASSSSPRAIAIGVRNSWLASSRNARSCSSAASMRASMSLRCLASSWTSVGPCWERRPRRRMESASASETSARIGRRAAPTMNHAATITTAASTGSAIASVRASWCCDRSCSSSEEPTATITRSEPMRSGPASNRALPARGGTGRSSVTLWSAARARCFGPRTGLSRSALGDASSTAPAGVSTCANDSARGMKLRCTRSGLGSVCTLRNVPRTSAYRVSRFSLICRVKSAR